MSQVLISTFYEYHLSSLEFSYFFLSFGALGVLEVCMNVT